jgi:hypothetical protein
MLGESPTFEPRAIYATGWFTVWICFAWRF